MLQRALPLRLVAPLAGRCLNETSALPAAIGFQALGRRSATTTTASPNPKPVAAREIPLYTGRPRLVVIGTGWGGARLLHDIDPREYDLTVISERNHMVFTPLLASTTVGTLDARSVAGLAKGSAGGTRVAAVHITDIQRALFNPQNNVFIATATSVDPQRRVVHAKADDSLNFEVPYDKLVIATGSQGSTFGIKGVLEHTHFLRDVHQAEAIRQTLIDNVAKAGIPGRSQQEVERLLHVVIVGGGPTGVEFAGELTDFVQQDLKRLYPERARAMRITLVEAREVLGSFDPTLREYAARRLVDRGVVLRKGVVQEVRPGELQLKDGTVLPFGMCVWSTGVGPTPFVTSLPFSHTTAGRLMVDKYLRVLGPSASPAPPSSSPQPGTDKKPSPSGQQQHQPAAGPGAVAPSVNGATKPEANANHGAATQVVPGVYALGDCCANPDNPLPALAQVAEQQGKYLARVLNEEAKANHPKKGPGSPITRHTPPHEFIYKSLGSMATVGGYSGVLELHSNRTALSPLSIRGWVSWFAWRSAYLTRLGSIRKRFLVAFNWTSTFLFGRDMSRW